ncbi:MAG: M20/M25/M40 family metallo-hydrolase [Pyrinomonadaceae bacterium MAG19_C2-C3]|nr:M20/M25/M40 family metallo-hydrolase [Pyrinomonadaceae bacterium MAG19_C2-C3]
MTTHAETFAFTRDLIDIPSVSGDERAVADFLRWRLEQLGFNVEAQTVEGERVNLIATTNHAPRVVFSTHIDTVPPFVASSEDDKYIYGRGACDTKGIIAAMLSAAMRVRDAGEERIGMMFVVGEETTSIGAQVANRHAFARGCRFLINGEPTENRLGIGSKGSLRVRLKAKGMAAHSAYPEQGESAIEKMLDVLADVREAKWIEDEFYGATTVNIGTITGGVRPNVIPATCEADLQIRLVCDSSRLKPTLENVVAGRVGIEYLGVTEPVRLHAVEGFTHEVVRFTTDVPHLSNWGTPLLLGAGSILDAHTAHEKISKAQLIESIELYTRLAHNLFAQVTKNVDEASL